MSDSFADFVNELETAEQPTCSMENQLGPREQQRDVVGLGRPALVVDLRVAADDAVQRRERAEEAAHLPHAERLRRTL